jgi:hypothetical protein
MRWHRCTTPQEPPYQLPQQPLYPPLHKPPHPRSIGHHTHLKPLLWNTTKGPRKETTHGPQPTSRSASYRAQRGRQRRAATRRPRTDRSQRRALPHTEHSADASSEQRPGDHARTATDVAPCLIPSTARTPAASNYFQGRRCLNAFFPKAVFSEYGKAGASMQSLPHPPWIHHVDSSMQRRSHPLKASSSGVICFRSMTPAVVPGFRADASKCM